MATESRGKKVFRHDIGQLISGRHVADKDTAVSDVVAQPKVTNIDVFAVLPDVVRLCKGDSAGVVLEDGSM
eukprot:scaffold15016_cov19-Prasinocladus_malaysianus.AAC.1